MLYSYSLVQFDRATRLLASVYVKDGCAFSYYVLVNVVESVN